MLTQALNFNNLPGNRKKESESSIASSQFSAHHLKHILFLKNSVALQCSLAAIIILYWLLRIIIWDSKVKVVLSLEELTVSLRGCLSLNVSSSPANSPTQTSHVHKKTQETWQKEGVRDDQDCPFRANFPSLNINI